ncbi:MAG: galactokinase [Ktedonobacteraceae bacterium]|nr:galactokinase [Ktedonobacteraceae bacterium]
MEQIPLLPAPQQALTQFPLVFHDNTGYAGPPGVAWAPGRVNLIGEHTDYNDGFVLPLAIDRVAAFAGRRRADRLVRLWSVHFSELAQFTLEGLPASFERQRESLPRWTRYILGVAAELAGTGLSLQGFDAVVDGDVPLGGGMSSSAALEVDAAQAFALFSDGALTIGSEQAVFTPMQVAALCQKAEHRATGLRSGILDQAASVLGRPGKAVLLDCRSLEYRYLPFDAPVYSLLVIDTGVRRELTSSAYNERRQQCEEAVSLLKEAMLAQGADILPPQDIRALRDITPEQFIRYQHVLPPVLRRRAGYVIAENERVLQVVRLLEQGEIEAVGAVLWQGHAGLRDEYEVSCLELDTLVEIARRVPGVLGARMMGGGFGGCTVNLVRNEAIDALKLAVEQQYAAQTGRQASIDICRAAAGPGQSVAG